MTPAAGPRNQGPTIHMPDPFDAYRPHVSLIVAIYNAAATLRDCLESLLQLDYPRSHLEVLCVDNASTDDTPRILEGYGDRFRILREEKRGPAAARNAGLRRTVGEVVALTDSDCVVDPNWLGHLVGPLRDSASRGCRRNDPQQAPVQFDRGVRRADSRSPAGAGRVQTALCDHDELGVAHGRAQGRRLLQ